MPPATRPPTIHKAMCALDGSGGVTRGIALSEAEAIAQRQSGQDVAVCGVDTFANARLAYRIESAIGPCKPDGPHVNVAGVLALPHFQQRRPPPIGHTFYETPKRKAVSAP